MNNTPATLYSWEDVGAPQIEYNSTNTTGYLYSILKAVLINGYGTRTPVGGWLLAFDDEPNKTLVLKHATEDKFLRIKDNVNDEWAEALGFTAMTDVDTGTGQFPSNAYLGTSKYLIGKKNGTSSSVQSADWRMLVADNGEWFYYLGNYASSTAYPTGFFFGKTYHPIASAQRWMLTGYRSTSMSVSVFPRTLYEGTDHVFQDDRYLTGNEEFVYFNSPNTLYVLPNAIDGSIITQPGLLESVRSPLTMMGFTPNRYRVQGELDGVYAPNATVTINGLNYVVVHLGSSNTFLYNYTSS